MINVIYYWRSKLGIIRIRTLLNVKHTKIKTCFLLFSIISGSDIPGQASLVFDVVLLDLHNPKDGIAVTNQVVPESCTRKTIAGDFVRYHYNGSLLDGTFFDSRFVIMFVWAVRTSTDVAMWLTTTTMT